MTCAASGSRTAHARLSLAVAVHIRAVCTWLRTEADQRTARPWLGLVGMALAVSAVLLTNDGLALPVLAVCAWWWCPRDRFGWLLPLGTGILTVAWVSVGSGLITLLPLSTAGLLWTSWAAGLAVLAAAASAVTDGRRR
jgi:hypothetical protein